MNKKKQSGHVAVEWVVVTLLITMALFAPIPGENQSVMGVLMDSIRDFHRNSSLHYSLP